MDIILLTINQINVFGEDIYFENEKKSKFLRNYIKCNNIMFLEAAL